MKTGLISVLALVALIGGIQEVRADDGALAGYKACQLTFEAKGGGIQYFIGDFEMKGQGQILCWGMTGKPEAMPVKIKIGGTPMAPLAAWGVLQVKGIAYSAGVVKSIKDVAGTYLAAQSQGAFISGFGGAVAYTASSKGVTLNTTLTVVSGFGATYGLTTMEITPDDRRSPEPQPEE